MKRNLIILMFILLMWPLSYQRWNPGKPPCKC